MKTTANGLAIRFVEVERPSLGVEGRGKRVGNSTQQIFGWTVQASSRTTSRAWTTPPWRKRRSAMRTADTTTPSRLPPKLGTLERSNP